jgi:hypothetical protein
LLPPSLCSQHQQAPLAPPLLLLLPPAYTLLLLLLLLLGLPMLLQRLPLLFWRS